MRFLEAVGEAGAEVGHHPRVSMGEGYVVDDSDAPSLTVIADPEGNRGAVCVAAVVAGED